MTEKTHYGVTVSPFVHDNGDGTCGVWIRVTLAKPGIALYNGPIDRFDPDNACEGINPSAVPELVKALREISIWTQESQDRAEKENMGIRLWRGCVAIAEAALAKATGKV